MNNDLRFESNKEKKKKRINKFYDDKLKNYDYFEKCIADQNKSVYYYYYFNPYTGENVFDVNIIIRSMSLWSPTKRRHEWHQHPSAMYLLPESYLSRIWGRRKFVPYNGDKVRATTHIASVARGFIARIRLRHYFKTVWQKVINDDNKSSYFGFYYFYNTITGETTWLKPRLAFPDDIEFPVNSSEIVNGLVETKGKAYNNTYDKDNNEDKGGDQQNRYSKGPFIVRGRLGKNSTSRFQKPLVSLPVKTEEPADIDFESASYREVSSWLDNNIGKLPNFADLKILSAESNWKLMVERMKDKSSPNNNNNNNNLIVQMYGFHSMSRMEISVEEGTGLVSEHVVSALNYCLETLQSVGHGLKFGCNLLMFTLYALLEMLSNHSVRAEFFDTNSIPIDASSTGQAKQLSSAGDAAISDMFLKANIYLQNAAIEKYLEDKLSLFCKYLLKIPVEVREEQASKTSEGVMLVAYPTKRGIDMVDLILKIIGLLAHERSCRDVVAQYCSPYILEALKVCRDEYEIVGDAFKCLYNFCFMCEIAQQFILENTNILGFIAECKCNSVISDDVVQRELRRLEVALSPDGWRGKVEEIIEREMQEERKLMHV